MGKAKNLKKRVSSYFSHKSLDTKTVRLVSLIKDISFIQVRSEIEAFLLESSLIKKHKPFYNIKFIDDKSYPMIQITNNQNPSITIVRKIYDRNASYFGPYSDATALKTVLKIIRKIFPYQSVKNHPKRTCLYYHLGLCPCILSNQKNLPEYKKNLKRIEKFLNGNIDNVIKQLVQEQKLYIKTEEFEKALEIQKKLDGIKLITSNNYEPFKYIEKPDFYFERIKQEQISLKHILKPYFPEINELFRIECYDISNFSGKQATGSMVVFENGEKKSSEYRRFKIRTKNTPDDFHMMQEVLLRRLKNKKWTLPDLIVVDGGKGQVSTALKVITQEKLKLPIIGLAKREETIVIPQKIQSGVEFIELKLPKSVPGINLLRRMRDEAHRFAISYHRLLRKKAMLLGT